MATDSADPARDAGWLPKAEWGPGPWQDEPDHVEWRHVGLPCLAHRNHFGVWCGYVAVPPGHPLHGVNHNDLDESIEAHGGLSYAAACEGDICHVPAPGEPDDVWWFGFDCARVFDRLPEMEARDRLNGRPPLALDDAVYRTLAYVTAETNRLAEQLTPTYIG